MKFLSDIVCQGAESFGTKLAVKDPQSELSYAELGTASWNVGRFLNRLGIGAGDRVILLLPNSVEFAQAQFGILCAGAISVPCDSAATASSLKDICASCGPRAIITDPAIWKRIEASGWSNPSLEHVLFFRDGDIGAATQKLHILTAIERFQAGGSPFKIAVNEEDVATLMYTTGTTGGAKGVPLTHNNVFAALRNIISYVGYSPSDREVVILPLSHNFGLGHLYCNLISGGAVYTENGMARVGRVLKQLSAFKATGFPGTPTGMGILIDKYPEIFKEHGQGLRFSVVNSAPLPPERTEQLRRLLPNLDILVYYGLTEASRSTFISLTKEGPDYYRSVGPSMNKVEVKVLDDQGRDKAVGEVGEVLISGPTVTKGYWSNPELNALSFKDGALRTGDLGYRDARGYLFITGRIKDVVNVGGYKVFPGEIEEVISNFPGIADSGVAGAEIPGVTGETVVAGIVEQGETVDLDALRAYCFKHLENFKVPQVFERLPQIPRTNTGKAKRQELAKLIQNLLANQDQ